MKLTFIAISFAFAAVTSIVSFSSVAKADCQGFANTCSFSLGDRFTCERQRGCFWNDFSKNCTGFPMSCSSFSNWLSCQDQRGCRWVDPRPTPRPTPRPFPRPTPRFTPLKAAATP